MGDVPALADRLSATLPRFASVPQKEDRAPQNLHPIAGLERELRHRLGDPRLLFSGPAGSGRQMNSAGTSPATGKPIGRR